MTYADSIKYLYDLQLFGTKLELENVFKLAELAGNPQEKLRFIHVAGTNGKGSTCAMLESVYRSAGLRVGLFTSPHLAAFGERIQVNRQLIGETNIVRLVGKMKDLSGHLPGDRHPTFFETVTVMALCYFVEQKCDLVIWEAGLGGRLDATNIVTPLASVITNIQMDHQVWLGNTLAAIAREKAGIIKPGVPVISGVDQPEAMRVLFATARENNSPFWLISRRQTDLPPLRNLPLSLPGQHQRMNAAVALWTVRTLTSNIFIGEDIILDALAKTHWPGRLQLVERDGRKIVLDGAHNAAGAEALSAAWLKMFLHQPTTLALGILRDKDCENIVQLLAPLADRILLVPVQSHRTALPENLAGFCRQANPKAVVTTCASAQEALDLASQDPLTLVAGSLYLIGEMMALLGLSTASPQERSLNEWGKARK